jgi:hypothetical protein
MSGWAEVLAGLLALGAAGGMGWWLWRHPLWR